MFRINKSVYSITIHSWFAHSIEEVVSSLKNIFKYRCIGARRGCPKTLAQWGAMTERRRFQRGRITLAHYSAQLCTDLQLTYKYNTKFLVSRTYSNNGPISYSFSHMLNCSFCYVSIQKLIFVYFSHSTKLLAATTLRNVLGKCCLKKLFTWLNSLRREHLNFLKLFVFHLLKNTFSS